MAQSNHRTPVVVSESRRQLDRNERMITPNGELCC